MFSSSGVYQLLRGTCFLGSGIDDGAQAFSSRLPPGPKLLRETARLSLYRQAGGRALADRERLPAAAFPALPPGSKVFDRGVPGRNPAAARRGASGPLGRPPARILNSG